jgi:hypothetical protein
VQPCLVMNMQSISSFRTVQIIFIPPGYELPRKRRYDTKRPICSIFAEKRQAIFLKPGIANMEGGRWKTTFQAALIR